MGFWQELSNKQESIEMVKRVTNLRGGNCAEL